MIRKELIESAALVAVGLLSSSCVVQSVAVRDTTHVMNISVPSQKLALYREGQLVKTYPVSTSKYGLGNEKGSYRTPLGKMEVAQKIGDGKPAGAVFKSRKWTGEIVKPDSPGRDPIVSRILWLNGLERKNKDTYSRCIYIHGTAAEAAVGKPVSYGCVRMTSKDVIDLYKQVGEGSTVYITKKSLKEEDENKPESAIEPIRAIPMAETDIPAVLQAYVPRVTRPVWKQEGNFGTGVDVLSDVGFERDYLAVPPPQELALD